MRFQNIYFRLFIGALVLAVVFFAISFGATRMAGETGSFPQVVFNAIGGRISPTIDTKEDLSLDLAGVTDLIIDTRNANVRIAPLGEAKILKAIQEANSAVLNLSGRVPAPMAAKDVPPIKVLQVKREGSTYEILVNEQSPKSDVKVTFDIDGASKSLALKVFLPPAFRGRVVVRTVSGDVKFRNLNLSRMQISSTSGDVKAEEVQANELAAESVSGDIKAIGSFDAMKMETTSGEVKLAWKPLSSSASHQIDVRTVSGDAKIAVPAESNFSVQMKSVTGELKTKFPGFELREGPGTKSTIGKIGSGQGSMKVVTVSGDLKLEAIQADLKNHAEKHDSEDAGERDKEDRKDSQKDSQGDDSENEA